MRNDFTFLCLMISGVILNAATQSAVNQDKPPLLYFSSYNMSDNGSVLRNSAPMNQGLWNTTFSGNMHWNDGSGGGGSWAAHDLATEPYATWDDDESWSWPANSWNAGTSVETYLPSAYAGLSFTNVFPDYIGDDIFFQHCNVSVSGTFSYPGISVVTTAETRSIQIVMKLQTGGKAISSTRHLFGLTASVTQSSPGLANDSAEPVALFGDSIYYLCENTGGTNIPAQNITLGSFGALSANGVLYTSLPDNASVVVTPAVANVPFYSFNLSQNEVQTKADWQKVVQNEIDSDSGVTIENYSPSAGFMTNRANIQAVYAFYQKLYTEQPGQYYWAGLAKLAGATVYAGLSDAQHIGLLSTFQQTLMQMMLDIFDDLAWQLEAYRIGGLAALEKVAATPGNQDLVDTNTWQMIDQGIQQNNLSLIIDGNKALLLREQQQVLAPGYALLSSMTGIATVMSLLAESPVPNPNGNGLPYAPWNFQTIVPGGNLADFDDRWAWIDASTGGIWITWLYMSDSYQLSTVSTPLTTRAAYYSTFPIQ